MSDLALAGDITRPQQKIWTEHDDAMVRQMRADGAKWDDIDARVGGNARKRLERLSMTPEQKEARKIRERGRPPSGISISWTDKQVERLKTLYAQGKSFAIIGAELGTSRCACLGKARRLKLPPRLVTEVLPNPTRQKGVKRPRINKPRLRVARANTNSNGRRVFYSIQTEFDFLRCIEVPSLDLKITQLTETTCRYIAGDPCTSEGASYCGNAIFKRSFCEGHFWLCYQPRRAA